MAMPTLQQIIGTITGKVAFERTQANFTIIKDAHDSLETTVGTKAPNADLDAHKAENVHIGKNQVTKVRNTANQSIPSSVFTDLNFNTLLVGDSGDLVSSTMICRQAGIYVLVLSVRFAESTGGRRNIILCRNGINIVEESISAATDTLIMMSTSTIIPLSVNDVISARVFQDSGGAIDSQSAGDINPFMAMVKVG